MLSTKETALHDLRNSQPLQIAFSGNRVKGVTGQPYAKA